MKVYEFSTAKDFIQSTFAASQSGNSAMTVKRYAQSLGLATSTLKMILCGKRKPTIHQVLSVARVQRLSPADTSYLETLSLRDTAHNIWEKVYYAKMLALKKKEVKLSTVSTSEKELLSDPLIFPLLVYFMENKKADIDPAKLAQALRLPKQRILDLLTQFQKNEVLMRLPDGAFHVAFETMSHRLVQKKYLKRLLVEAASKVDSEYDKPESFFVSYAFSSTPEALIELQLELKALMEKYLAANSESIGEQTIAQACFQVFPVIRA